MAPGNAWVRRAQARRSYLRKLGHDIPSSTRTRGISRHTQRFLAIDGEGGDRRGEHIYTLLVAAGKNYSAHIDNNGEPLGTLQCFEFIMGLPKKRHIISFFFNYDITMMLRDMPIDLLRELCDRESRTNPETGKTKRVYWQGYGLDWIPGKMFILDKVTAHGRNDSRTIWDTSGFFQTSLVKALEGWNVGTPDEKQFIERMKQQRNAFTGDVTPEVIAYAETECVLLCKLMDLVYKESHDLGYTLHSYSGAGSLANSIMSVWGIDKAKTELPAKIDDAAYHAYFGGRFETCAVGEIPGPIHEYDINSAYPYAIQDLPDLTAGEWQPAKPDTMPHRYGLYYVEWKCPRGKGFTVEWGPLPWRGRGGGVSYPMSGRGWYWGIELYAALQTYHAPNIRIMRGYEYVPDPAAPLPFAHVPELYARRAELKQAGHLGQMVLKLGLNSLYGKTAQSVGARRYASIVWAGMITATARAMLTEAIHAAGTEPNAPNVVMVATDAVYSRVPIPELSIGDALGEWGHDEHTNMLIVQPGLYALDVGTPGREAIRKTRGIRKTAFNAADVLSIWRQDGMYGEFQAPTRSFIGLKRGLVSTQYGPGEWVEETRTVSFMPRSKRIALPIPDPTDVHYLPTIPSDRLPKPSAKYQPGTQSPELQAFLSWVANDSFQPNPGEHRPSIIPGFQTVGTE